MNMGCFDDVGYDVVDDVADDVVDDIADDVVDDVVGDVVDDIIDDVADDVVDDVVDDVADDVADELIDDVVDDVAGDVADEATHVELLEVHEQRVPDGGELRRDDRQHRDVDAVELVEAAPRARLTQAREDLAHRLLTATE